MRLAQRFLSTALVLAEIEGGKVAPSTLSAITAAAKCGTVKALLVGKGVSTIAEQLSKVNGLSEVLVADSDAYNHQLPEEVAAVAEGVVKSSQATHIVAAASAFGKGLIPRVAARFDCSPLTNITSIDGTDTYTRLAYAGNAVVNVKLLAPMKFLVVRSTSFERAAIGGASAPINAVGQLPPPFGKTTWVEDKVTASDRPDLQTASVVVSGGRALKSQENFKIIEQLAKVMNAAVGATRAAVDAGYAPNDIQVGQTGKVVAPAVYVAVGLSGAIQHLAGMKDAKYIACINSDDQAPIFEVSDCGLVADLFKAVPTLTELLGKK